MLIAVQVVDGIDVQIYLGWGSGSANMSMMLLLGGGDSITPNDPNYPLGSTGTPRPDTVGTPQGDSERHVNERFKEVFKVIQEPKDNETGYNPNRSGEPELKVNDTYFDVYRPESTETATDTIGDTISDKSKNQVPGVVVDCRHLTIEKIADIVRRTEVLRSDPTRTFGANNEELIVIGIDGGFTRYWPKDQNGDPVVVLPPPAPPTDGGGTTPPTNSPPTQQPTGNGEQPSIGNGGF